MGQCYGRECTTGGETWKNTAGKSSSTGSFYSLHNNCISNGTKNSLTFIKQQRAKLYIVRRCITMLLLWHKYGKWWRWGRVKTKEFFLDQSLITGLFVCPSVACKQQQQQPSSSMHHMEWVKPTSLSPSLQILGSGARVVDTRGVCWQHGFCTFPKRVSSVHKRESQTVTFENHFEAHCATEIVNLSAPSPWWLIFVLKTDKQTDVHVDASGFVL